MPTARRLLCLVAALALLPGCVLVTGSFQLFDSKPQPLEERVVSGEGSSKILLIDISNAITSQDVRDGFGFVTEESTIARVQAELQMARKDDAVRALVLRLNSPGGTVTASDSIFHALSQFKQDRQIPVVAHFLDVAASGAYYVALAADEIIASPTSVTGSVGAVMYSVNLHGLMEKIGVEDQTIKSGDKKDIGSPLREMTEEDREILLSIINGMRERFVGLVEQRRPGIEAGVLETIADGRIFSADQALRIGLVDRVGHLQEAIDVAQRRARVAQARVIMYRRPREYSESVYSRASPGPVELNLLRLDAGSLGQGPSFLYMWMPQDVSTR